MNNYDYLFKFILIGDSTVGKTCILTRFVDGFFKQDSDPTIGVEFGSKVLKCENDLTVRLQVWDTAGQESFRSITRYTSDIVNIYIHLLQFHYLIIAYIILSVS